MVAAWRAPGCNSSGGNARQPAPPSSHPKAQSRMSSPTFLHSSAPAIGSNEPDAHWLFLAGKYLSKSFGHFDETIGRADLPHDALDFFRRATDDEAPVSQT